MAFIGTIDEYEEYKKTEDKSDKIGEGNKIEYDILPEIDQADFKLLKQIILHHDPYTVYMQSDADLYDPQYNEEYGEDIDKEFMDEIKAIRRIYKSYPKWAHAVKLRNKYLDDLVEKYGGEDKFTILQDAGLVKDWIPPEPIYSTSSSDYQNYLEGRFVNINDWDDELLESILEQKAQEFEATTGKKLVDLGIRATVAVDPIVINNMEVGKTSTAFYRKGGVSNTFDGVSTSNINELQEKVRSWIDPDYHADTKENNKNGQLFSMTADAIRERFYTAPIVNGGGMAEYRAKIDEYGEEDIDWDEMVMDAVTGRPMTRAELRKREFIRYLKDLGWDEVRLMRHLGVGSGFELKLMEEKNRVKRGAKKKAKSLASELCGEDISTIEELSDVLFDD